MNYLHLYAKYMMQNVHVKCEKKGNRTTRIIMDTQRRWRERERERIAYIETQRARCC
jgi:hypothetical protein